MCLLRLDGVAVKKAFGDTTLEWWFVFISQRNVETDTPICFILLRHLRCEVRVLNSSFAASGNQGAQKLHGKQQ